MKKYTIHISSVTLGLLVTAFVAVRFMYAKEDPANRATQEHKHLELVIKTAEQVIADGQNLAESFLDTSDNHSVAWYVQAIEGQMREVSEKLIRPLELICNESNHSNEYVVILKKTHTLLMEIQNNLKVFLHELKQNQANKNPISFAKAMRDLDKKLSPRAQVIRQKLVNLQTTVSPFDDSIARQVQRFINEFDTAQKNTRSTASALKGIVHRVKC